MPCQCLGASNIGVSALRTEEPGESRNRGDDKGREGSNSGHEGSISVVHENLPIAKFPSLLKLLRILQIPDIDALTLLENIMSEITFSSTRWLILGSFVAIVVL